MTPMLARRNQCFAVAAIVAAVAMAILAVGAAIEANFMSQEGLSGGYVASGVIFLAAYLVGTGGWVVVQTGFGDEIDWRSLRLGGAVVAAGYLAYGAGAVVRMAAAFASSHQSQFRFINLAMAIAALLLGAAFAVGASGFGDKHQGASRAARVWVAAILAIGSFLAMTTAELIQQDYWSRFGLPHEQTIGATVIAAGALLTGVGALVLARVARSPLRRREAGLATAAAIAVGGTLVVVVGEALVAIAYSGEPGEPGSILAFIWLAVAARAVVAVAIGFVALGARRAACDLEGPGAGEEEAALARVVGEGGGAAELG